MDRIRADVSSRIHVVVEVVERAAAVADGGAVASRSASRGNAARALLRSGLRRRHRAGRQRIASRCGRVACARRAHRLPDGVLRHLVGVDGLHLVRIRVRLRRRAVSAARFRANCGCTAHGGGHHVHVGDADAQHRHGRRLRDHAARAGRAVASRIGFGSHAPLDGATICARYHDSPDGLGRNAPRAAVLAAGIPDSGCAGSLGADVGGAVVADARGIHITSRSDTVC